MDEPWILLRGSLHKLICSASFASEVSRDDLAAARSDAAQVLLQPLELGLRALALRGGHRGRGGWADVPAPQNRSSLRS